MINKEVSFASGKGQEFSIVKTAVANINPDNCVNCGKCREYCPVGAIEEQQRLICRLCPECTEQPALKHSEMVALSTAKACTTACPLGISPQGYINLTKAGKTKKAFEIIWDKNPLPSVCGRICNHPCEEACKRGLLVDEPMAIRGIKRYLSDKVEFEPEAYPVIYEEEIAIVGAGPAGLTAAHYLASAGYSVTVVDEMAGAGGMLRRAIPTFRLPRDILDKEIKRLETAGISFRLGVKVNPVKMKELQDEFDIVIVAAGAVVPKELKIPNWRAEGIVTAMNFMEHVNNGQSIKRHPGQVVKFVEPEVVVLGGGAVAIDAARTAKRLGAKSVKAVCIESGADVPCHKWELDQAQEEGIELVEGWAPKEYVCKHSKVEGVTFGKVKDFCKDESGKISFSVDDDEVMTLSADWVILGIGQTPDAMWNQFTNDEKVLFAGDVQTGTTSVVDAMAAGKKAAVLADAKLRDREVRDPLELRVLHPAPLEQKIYPANRLKIDRPELPILDPEKRAGNFEEVEGSYSDDVIATEVMRCLQCGYQKVDTDKCIGCGVCQKICTKGDVITMIPVEQ